MVIKGPSGFHPRRSELNLNQSVAAVKNLDVGGHQQGLQQRQLNSVQGISALINT
jgi:hypothetical protein